MGRRTIPVIVLLFTSLAAISTAAATDGPAFTSGVDVGLGTADEDWLFLVLARQGLAVGGFELTLEAPLRFVIADDAPEQDGALRDQDWDDPSDFARIARRISFFHELDDGFVDAYLGELDGVGIGHGSAMDLYFNSTDMDHYKGGAKLHLDIAANGLEMAMDDVVSPGVLLGRAYLTPLGWFIRGDWPRRLEIGYTLGADLRAPRRTTAASDTRIPVTGGDISIRVLDNDIIELTPYADLMVMDGSIGFHAGLATSITLSRGAQIVLGLRGEYRRSGWDYHPAVFNPFYERNRRYYGYDTVTDTDNTLADALAVEDSSASYSNGMMAQANLDWGEKVGFTVRYDREGSDRLHWLLFRLDINPSERFTLRGFYAGQDLEAGGDIFSGDSLIGLGSRFAIVGPLSVFTEFTRRWRRFEGEMEFANESAFGVGVHISY